MSNPLEDLGLNLGDTVDPIIATTEADAPSAEPATPAATKATRAPRVEVEVGDIEINVDPESLESLTPLTRGGGASGGSKYPFEKLTAPVKQENGTWGYPSFKVMLLDGVDEDALKRSVQSANTQANSKAKKAGEPNYYVTRSIIEGGKFVGMKVFRVDATLGGE